MIVQPPGDLTYRYDPRPMSVQDAEAEARWEKFRREGGWVLEDGVVIGRALPAVEAPDEPGGWVTTVRRPKAEDITDDAFLAALDPDGGWTSWSTVTERLRFPDKVVLAKARILIDRRGTVHGCPCGCRGDWHRGDECKGC